MALLRCLIVAILLLLITASLFQPAMARGCGRSTRKRGARGNMEHFKVQKHEGIAEAAMVINSTFDQTLPKVAGNNERLHTIQFHGTTEYQENGRSKSLRQRKLKPKFQCKRLIPGGPDPQHHSQNGK